MLYLARPALRSFLPLICLAFASSASAAVVTYNLDQNGCSVGCSVLPVGTITVTSTVANEVNVSVELLADYSFRSANDPNHHGLVFNLAGNPTVSIANITSGNSTSQTWALSQASTYNDSPFGTFEYSLDCTTCSPGMSGVQTRNLSFTLQATGLTASSFIPTGNIYFAVDVVGKTAAAGIGETGNVGALQGTASNVPEPSSVVMCVSASAIALVRLARRRA